ncbi:MAG TPA: LacI family DNA-binding transcriptional regulator [Opitutaceae bacterium]
MPETASSIRTLAAQLGLSRTTVSDALRNAPWVSTDTARRVQAAAEEAGYKLNPLASAVMSHLRQGRGRSFLGVLAAVNLDDQERSPAAMRFHHALVAGAQQRAEELGFKLQPFHVGKKGVTLHRLDTILQSRGIQGILLLPAWQAADFSGLDWSRYAGVYTDYVIDRPALHVVCSDHYRSMIGVLQRLHARGYGRVGLFMERHLDERLQYRWASAFTIYQRNHPELGKVPPLIKESIRRDAFVEWFKKHKPDVVLGHSADAVDWMEACGARVPETHGFVCLNVLMQDRVCAGLDLQPHLLGARGIEQVIAQLQRNERGIPGAATTTMLAAQWRDGPTLPVVNGKG